MNNLIIELKTLIITAVGLVTSILSPIGDFMLAMLILLTVNLFFGIANARANGEPWSWKKACMFFVFCAIFLAIVALVFLLGHLMHNDPEAILCVKYICFIAVWVFGTNILKNWRGMLKEGTATYRFVDILLYILQVQFVEKLPFVKKYQESEGQK